MTRAKDPVEASRERVDSKTRSEERVSPHASTHLGNQEEQALHRAGKHASVEVGRSDDVHEAEADRMADRVMQMEAPSPAAKAERSDAAGASASGSATSPLGEGRPLDAAERSYFEPRFGMSFDGVRIHTGPEAAQSAAGVRASAYTLGSDVVFGEGRYQPGATESRRLLAHELAHVAQERDGARPMIRRQALPEAEPAIEGENDPEALREPEGVPDAGPPEKELKNATGVVRFDKTEVFDSALRKNNVVQTLDAGITVPVTHSAGNYYKVKLGKTPGYILRGKLTVTSPEDKKPEDKEPEEKKPEEKQGPPPPRIVKPEKSPPINTPVPPPAGWKRHTPDTTCVAICNDVVAQKDPYQGTPQGTQIYQTVHGTELLFIVDWHKHPDTPEERERLRKIGKTPSQIEALVNWHRGCSVYEKVAT
jgi:hypothetical protein